jgi:hypothetical protein
VAFKKIEIWSLEELILIRNSVYRVTKRLVATGARFFEKFMGI